MSWQTSVPMAMLKKIHLNKQHLFETDYMTLSYSVFSFYCISYMVLWMTKTEMKINSNLH